MSAFSPELLKSLGAFIAAAPGSENHKLDSAVPQGAEQGGSPEQAPASPDAIAAGYTDAADQATQEGRGAGERGSADALKAVDSMESSGKEAIKAGEQADTALAVAEKGTFDDALANIGKFDDHFATTMADVRQKTQTAYNHYMTTVEDYKNTHVYSWYEHASTGSQIAGYISQFLAGGLQGLTGQLGAPTPMDKVIEHDLQLQKMNIAQTGEVASQARGLYNDLKAQFKDEVVVEGAMREIAYNSVIARLKNIAGGMASPAAQAKAKQEIANLESRVAQIRADVLIHKTNVEQNGAMQQAGVYENLASLWMQKAAAKGAPDQIGGAVSGITGSEYLDATQRDNLGKQKQAASELLRQTKGLQELIKNKAKMDPAEYANAKNQFVNSMVLAKKNVDELGAISKGDMSLAEGTIGAAGGFTDSLKRLARLDSDPDQIKRLAKFFLSTKTGWAKTVGSLEVVNKTTGQRMKLRDTEGLGE